MDGVRNTIVGGQEWARNRNVTIFHMAPGPERRLFDRLPTKLVHDENVIQRLHRIEPISLLA